LRLRIRNWVLKFSLVKLIILDNAAEMIMMRSGPSKYVIHNGHRFKRIILGCSIIWWLLKIIEKEQKRGSNKTIKRDYDFGKENCSRLLSLSLKKRIPLSISVPKIKIKFIYHSLRFILRNRVKHLTTLAFVH